MIIDDCKLRHLFGLMILITHLSTIVRGVRPVTVSTSVDTFIVTSIIITIIITSVPQKSIEHFLTSQRKRITLMGKSVGAEPSKTS